MKSEWRVYPRVRYPKKGKPGMVVYIVARLKDIEKMETEDNLEISGPTNGPTEYSSYREAYIRANYMNSKEEPEEVLKDGIERG